MTDSSLPKTLDAWLARLEASHPTGIDLGLDRVSAVARRMGLMDAPIAERVITVAGTNGKGSTVAMLEAFSMAHGLSVACYTSPHLLRYNERLRLDGIEAEDALLMAGFKAVEQARVSSPSISLTYFEVGTLGALWAIAQRRPQMAILEVGLGGRLDAVNIIDADVAVVTTVAQDHAAFLGTDINVIGREKAGIMRTQRPVVLGSDSLPPSVAEHARDIGALVHALGSDFNHDADGAGWKWQGKSASGQHMVLDALPDPKFPRDNAAAALQAFALGGVALEADNCRRALADVRLNGRMQWRGQWCLDVGHNPHAASWVAGQLGASDAHVGRTLCLLGMLGDKDAEGVIDALSPAIDAWLPVSLEGERARRAADLAEYLAERGLEVMHCADDPGSGADWLETRLEPTDRVLVTGSFLTVSAILDRWQQASSDDENVSRERDEIRNA
ncbi:bifunctional folylpolyglutamate synthase/dihydrofolate synthase [Halomonas cupida]|uniref:bifunctional folylpolyglutamate synthase/dihydrofolate synthase n=1 Tax=Halomonas cupida TaxID=44933 RepID=UPI003A8CBDED